MSQALRPDTGERPAGARDTAPRPARPRLPEIPGPVATARMAWRKLRRMSTALALLFAMAAAAVVATFVPQEPVIGSTVEAWRAGVEGPGVPVAALFDALEFFDVFGSWWFLALTALLFVSLTGCLVPRFRAFGKVVRRPPAAGRNLDRLSAHRAFATALTPDQALAAAERVLRRRRFRRRRLAATDSPTGADQLAAERGHWREGGSLLFHSAFYLLLVGIILGQARGFTGYVGLVEGQSFVDTRVSYENVAQVGRYWGAGDHAGFRGTLDDFEASFYPDGTAREYVADLTVTDATGAVRREQLRVNHPVRLDGMTLYQSTYGMAPRVVIAGADGGPAIYDKSVRLAPGEQPGWWTATERVTTGGEQAAGEDVPALPQMALDIAFLPDAREVEGPDGRAVTVPGSPTEGDARLFATLYLGDLGLERNEPMTTIRTDWFDPDTGALRPGITTETLALEEGGNADVLGGTLTASFDDLSLWSGIQVSHQPGRFVLLGAGVLLLAGLVPSLYSYRRRIWVDARPAADGGPGSEVVLAGVALQRPTVAAEEFDAVAEELAGVLPARPTRVPGPQPTSAPEPSMTPPPAREAI